jgi:hypothetical protein
MLKIRKKGGNGCSRYKEVIERGGEREGERKRERETVKTRMREREDGMQEKS